MSVGQAVPDAIGEWWVSPLATALTGPDRTVFGAIASNGDVLACEMNHATGAARRVVIGSTQPDDHNCPALVAVPGRRMVAIWTRHTGDSYLHVKASDASGDVESMAPAPEVLFAAGNVTSYAQIHHLPHLSDPAQDTYWVFTRLGVRFWSMVPMSVDHATGVVTFGTIRNLLDSVSQCYIATADAHAATGQVIRFAWGYNPAGAESSVRYIEIDTVTGAISSPVDPAVAANVDGTSLPLIDTDVAPLLPDVDEGRSRRLFYTRPGPSSPAVAWADWDDTTPDEATYHVTQWDGSAWTTRDYGIAGPRIGYTAAANYIAGMAFPDPCTDDRVAVARVSEGTSTVELWVGDQAEVLASSSQRLIRPTFAGGRDDRVLCSAVHRYGTSFTDYLADTWALFADPYTPVVTTGAARVTILVGELRTGRILAEVPVSAASWEQVHRDAGSVEATIPLLAREVTGDLLGYLSGPAYYLAAQRGNTVLEAGPIWAHDRRDHRSLTVRAAGLLSLFDHRLVMRVLAAGQNPAETQVAWSGVDLGTLAVRLVKLAMSHAGGSVPIVLPAERAGSNERTWEGFSLANLGDAIRSLMSVIGGPDVAFVPRLTADRLRIEWVMRVGTAAQPMLTQSGDDWEWDASVVRSAVAGLTASRDWSGLTMRHWAVGEGTDEATLLAMREDLALTGAGYPLLESTSSHTTVSRAATLTEHARAGLAGNLRPWQTWGLTIKGDPHIEDYRPGDWGRVWIPRDDPYLGRLLPTDRPYRTRILGIKGGLTDDVALTLAPTMEARR